LKVRENQKFSAVAFILLLWGGLMSFSPANGQAKDYEVYGNIIYRFTKYVEWNHVQDEFIIGVCQSDSAFEAIRKVTAGKQAGNRPIRVMKIYDLREAAGCAMLFITEEHSGSLSQINKIIQSKPVLVITESQGLASAGACINFAIADEKIKLEVNLRVINSRNLKISSELLRLSTVVEQ
jgi:hypothetical protein